MFGLESYLTTREMAVAIWAFVLGIWAVSRPGFRRALLGVGRALLHKQIIAVFLFLFAYAGLVVYGLYVVGYWSAGLLGPTALWVLFGGIPLINRAITSEDGRYWGRSVKDQLGIVVVIEVFVRMYTFSLPVELLLIPLLGSVVMLDTVARMNEHFAPVARLTGVLLAIAGFTLLTFALVSFLGDLRAGTPIDVRAATIVPLLFVLFLPCATTLSLATSYESMWRRLSIWPPEDPSVLRYAKRQLVRRLGLWPSRVRSFRESYAGRLMGVKTRKDIDDLLDEYTAISSP